MTDDTKSIVQSVAKAFAALRAFDSSSPELTVSEVAARAELDRFTSFRLIRTLVSLGYLASVPGSRRFRLTLKCLELGYLALSSQDLRAHAAPLLRECVPAIADAGSLAVLEGPDVVYLERVQTQSFRPDLDHRPGRRIRAYAAAIGQVQLAYLPQKQQIAILESVERVKFSERTLTDLGELLARLKEIRVQGFAVSDAENAYGLRNVAAPVIDAAGTPIAGISFTIEATQASLDEFVAVARPEALRVARELATAVRLSGGGITATSQRTSAPPA
ncbi:IclR family transcriptional regulator [Telmatospirillum sp.]|uniref:IclR family transcriptional regulator n=1 Tax=Telmatospirillum sp. TaxID=2079197 RepID=UPI0028470D76|nr:IclR family transcriptional regulator [Telmatospirillum sp.]MDR3441377.1 IclR family transcriptional regulator [Telmatospirillum sp.]